MVKHMKRILVLVLVFMMTITPITASATVTDAVNNPKEVTVDLVNTQTELDNAGYDNFVTLDAGQSEELMRIDVSKAGALFITAYASEGAAIYPNISLYTDAEGTQSISPYYSWVSDDSLTAEKDFTVKAGTYYVKLGRTDTSTTAKYALSVINLNSGAKTLTQNKYFLGFSKDGSKNTYYKITVTKPGSLELTTDFGNKTGTAYVTLCNSSKSAISAKTPLYSGGGTTYYGVKKGTYYVRVATSSGEYRIKRKLTNVSDTSGSTKAKAKTLKKGGTSVKAKGLMIAGESASKADWYKVTLSKRQNVVFGIAGNLNGKMSMEIVPAKGTFSSSMKVTIDPSNPGYSIESLTRYSNGTTSKTWAKGTYYIKVTKQNKQASGYYELYVK